MEEKRVKLGVDIGQLSNQLIEINNLVEENYSRAIQGQTRYNKILESSIELLEEQNRLVGSLGGQNVVINTSGGGGNDLANNDIFEDILETVRRIYEKISDSSTIKQNEINKESVAPTGGEGGETGGGGRNVQNVDIGREIQRGFGGLSGLVQKDPVFLLAALVSMVPWVGEGISNVISKVMGEAESYDKARHRFRGAGGALAPMFTSGAYRGMGLSDAEALEKQAGYYPQNIHLSIKDLEFEKGFNLSSGTVGSLLRSLRQDLNINQGASVLGAEYLQGLVSRGKINAKEVRGYTEDYLSILIDINQKQLELTGETYSVINSRLIENIASLNKNFADPTYLSKTVGGVLEGLRQAKSPQMEALQYYALSRVNPNASLWEMELMKENPTDIRSVGYFSNYLKLLLQSGSIQDAKFNIRSAFNLGTKQTDDLVNGILEAQRTLGSEFNLEEYLESNKIIKNFGGARQYISSEAGAATSAAERMMADTSNLMSDFGQPALEMMGTICDYLSQNYNINDTLNNIYNFISNPNSILGSVGQMGQIGFSNTIIMNLIARLFR